MFAAVVSADELIVMPITDTMMRMIANHALLAFAKHDRWKLVQCHHAVLRNMFIHA